MESLSPNYPIEPLRSYTTWHVTVPKTPNYLRICQYHTDTLPPETVQQGLSTHPAIFINETLSQLNPNYVQPGSLMRSAKTMQT